MTRTIEATPAALSLSDRANALFDAHIAPYMANKDPQDFVAIDPDTGDYEVAPEHNAASHRLQSRRPQAEIFVRRVGDECAYEWLGGSIEFVEE